MICWWVAVKAIFEMTDACLAASTTASRSPKSNNSHCSETAETAPLADPLPSRLVPRAPLCPLLP